MAVPAAFMSMVCGMSRSAFTITSVSSQSERLRGMMLPWERACMMSARLLMLFEAGNFMVALNVDGAVMEYCIFFLSFVYLFVVVALLRRYKVTANRR